jgi:hypothetical protein
MVGGQTSLLMMSVTRAHIADIVKRFNSAIQRKKLARTTVNIQEKSCHTERFKAFLAVSLGFKECSTLFTYTSIGKKPLITHPHVNCKSIAKVDVSK